MSRKYGPTFEEGLAFAESVIAAAPRDFDAEVVCKLLFRDGRRLRLAGSTAFWTTRFGDEMSRLALALHLMQRGGWRDSKRETYERVRLRPPFSETWGEWRLDGYATHGGRLISFWMTLFSKDVLRLLGLFGIAVAQRVGVAPLAPERAAARAWFEAQAREAETLAAAAALGARLASEWSRAASACALEVDTDGARAAWAEIEARLTAANAS